jgi:hypothetical protein
MERWFEFHLYLANWGLRRLMIRLPKRLFREDIDPFLRSRLGGGRDLGR